MTMTHISKIQMLSVVAQRWLTHSWYTFDHCPFVKQSTRFVRNAQNTVQVITVPANEKLAQPSFSTATYQEVVWHTTRNQRLSRPWSRVELQAANQESAKQDRESPAG
jgi:hypothetical protein